MVGNLIVEVFDPIGSQVDHGEQVDIVYLDIFKAFDQVIHRKILSVLYQHGFGSNSLAQVGSCLHKRFQRVIALSVSSRAQTTLGVPQG